MDAIILTRSFVLGSGIFVPSDPSRAYIKVGIEWMHEAFKCDKLKMHVQGFVKIVDAH